MSDNIHGAHHAAGAAMHWVIPAAAPPAADAGAAPADAPHALSALPNLAALLARMRPADRIDTDAAGPAMPYELLLATLNGLPGEPGRIPWAAFEHGIAGTACAAIHLCHWQIGADHVALTPPPMDLRIDAAQSAAFLAAMAPYFAEDGIALAPIANLPGTWLATGAPLAELRTLSVDRLVGQRLSRTDLDAAGNSPGAAVIRRLQNEMQMLLYTHPANDARQQAGLPPVNSFWVTGAGTLAQPVKPAAGVMVETRLHASAQRGDAAAHAAAWQAVDADLCRRLLAQLDAGSMGSTSGTAHAAGPAAIPPSTNLRLSLCGPRTALTFEPATSGLWSRLTRGLRTPPDPRSLLATL